MNRLTSSISSIHSSGRGEWEPPSATFARQMLVLTLATVLASPHSHFYGAVLVLAPLAALLARSPVGVVPVPGWRTMLVGGLLLSAILVPFVARRWLFGPCLLLALAMLLPERRSAAKGGRLLRPRPRLR